MALKDYSVSERKFISTRYGRNKNGGYGSDPANTPHQYRIITQDWVENDNQLNGFGQWASAMACHLGDPTNGMDAGGAFSSGSGIYDNPWRFGSIPFQPISAIGSSPTAPATFDLRIYQYSNGVIPAPMDPGNNYWGGSFGGYFTQLDPDVIHTAGGMGECAMFQRAAMLHVPTWNARPGSLIAPWFSDIPAPYLNGNVVTDLFIGLTAARVPVSSDQNPKLGLYEYKSERVVPGLKMFPQAVSVDGVTGDLEFTLGNHRLFSNEFVGFGPQMNHSGRQVLVYRNSSPVAATGVAIQTATITNSGGDNTVTIAGGLGEGVLASADREDYVIVLLGPVITDWDFMTNPAESWPGGLIGIGRFTNALDGSQNWYREEGFVPAGTESYAATLAMPPAVKLQNGLAGILSVRRIPGSATWSAGPAPTTPVFDYAVRIDTKQHPDESGGLPAINVEDNTGMDNFQVMWDGTLFSAGALFNGDVEINPGNLLVTGVGKGFVTATGGFSNGGSSGINEFDGATVFGPSVAGSSVFFSSDVTSLSTSTDFDFNDGNKVAFSGDATHSSHINISGLREVLCGTDPAAGFDSHVVFSPYNVMFPADQVFNTRFKGLNAQPTSSRVYAGRFVAANTLEYRGTDIAHFEVQGARGFYGYDTTAIGPKLTQMAYGATSLLGEMFSGGNFFGNGFLRHPLFSIGTGWSPGLDPGDHYKDAQVFGPDVIPANVKCAPNPGNDAIGFPVKLSLMDRILWDELEVTFAYRWNGPLLGGTDGDLRFEILKEKPMSGPWTGAPPWFVPPMPVQCEPIASMVVPLPALPPSIPTSYLFSLPVWGTDFETLGNQDTEATYWCYVFIRDQSLQGETTLLHELKLKGRMYETPTVITV